MKEFLLIVLTSTAVSGFVSLLASHFLENRRYLRDKKLAAYNGYFDMLDEFLRTEVGREGENLHKTSSVLQKLERASWNVKMLSNNEKISSICDSITLDYEEITELLKKIKRDKILETKDTNFDSLYDGLGEKKIELLKLAGKEINSWW